MSIKTKDGIVGNTVKKVKSTKKPKDLRPFVEEYESYEDQETERMLQRVAHDLCRRKMVVDLGVLTHPINTKSGVVIANEDLGITMKTPDGQILTEVRLDGLAVTRHGIAYLYHVTIDNRVEGTVGRFTVTDTDTYQKLYYHLKKEIPSVGTVIEDINEKKFELLSKYHNKALFEAGLAPARGMRWED